MTEHHERKPLTAATFPTTHEEAMRANPYDVARLWADRMSWLYHDVDSADAPQTALRELAAMSALASWTTRWQAVAAHQALRGGASLEQVADAIGGTPQDAAALWREWAAGQVELRGQTEGRIGLDPVERDQVAAVVDGALAGTERV
jgi:hypothetical protein